MTQSYERVLVLEQMLADIEALPQGDQFWLVERLMKKMRSSAIWGISETGCDRGIL